MKLKRNVITKLVLISLALCIAFTSVTLGFNSVTASAYTDDVSLESTDPKEIDAVAGMVVYGLNANIKVKNIAYNKKVTIHYKDSAYPNMWNDCEASYSHQLNGDYEMWKCIAPFRGDVVQYAIKYEVNGQTYWDNNGGSNYITYYDRSVGKFVTMK